MKKLLLTLFILGSGYAVNAQVLFEEDFQDVSDIEIVTEIADIFDEPALWALIDEDGLPDSNGEVSEWLWAIGPEHTFIDGTSEALIPLDAVEDTSPNGVEYSWMNTDGLEDTNFVFSSTSWLEGLADGNRNWMVLPLVDLTSDAVLTFFAGSSQGPRYSDGFAVMIATDGYDELDNYVEIFRVAQCVPPVPNSSTVGAAALDLTTAEIFHSPEDAYIPYEGFDPQWEGVYFHLGGQAYEEASSYRGLLEPFSVDLSAFDGESVRIAILHDSDDDVGIDVDEIKILGGASGLEESYTEYFEIYPNPVTDELNLQFTEKVNGIGMIRIIDGNGRLVQSAAFRSNGNAELKSLDVANLATGHYNLQVLRQGESPIFTSFVKK